MKKLTPLFKLLPCICFLINCNNLGLAGYVISNNRVYYISWNEADGRVKLLIQDADPKTFKKINSDYGKDNKHVFYHGNEIAGADPESFELIDDLYSKDKNRAYYGGTLIDSSSSKGFKVIDSYYSSDYKDIYYTTLPLHVCSTNNFKIFHNNFNESEARSWTTDGCYYYFMNFRIPSDDYKNVYLFKGSGGLAKDRKWVYYLYRKINVDDSGKKIIDTVDVATFTVTNFLDCKDKFGCINPYRGREKCD